MRRHHFVVYMEGITTYVLNFTLKPIKYNNFWIWIRINEFKSDLQSFEQQEKSRLWVLIEVYYFLKNLYSFPGGDTKNETRILRMHFEFLIRLLRERLYSRMVIISIWVNTAFLV